MDTIAHKQYVTSFTPRNNDIASYRREKSFWAQWSLIDLETGSERLCARFYGSGSTVYCVAWLWNGETTARGKGKAGGGGYHKPSAAMAYAFADMGLKLVQPFDGHGDSAMESALNAVARHIGLDRYMVHRAHG